MPVVGMLSVLDGDAGEVLDLSLHIVWRAAVQLHALACRGEGASAAGAHVWGRGESCG